MIVNAVGMAVSVGVTVGLVGVVHARGIMRPWT